MHNSEITISEITINNQDVTDSIIERFYKKGVLKITEHDDLSYTGFPYGTISIEYMINEDMHYKDIKLVNGKVSDTIVLPEKIPCEIFCFIVDTCSKDTIAKTLSSNLSKNNNYCVSILFTFSSFDRTQIEEVKECSDYVVTVVINPNTLMMEYNKDELKNIISKMNDKISCHCFGLTTYFAKKIIYKCNDRVELSTLYYVDCINISPPMIKTTISESQIIRLNCFDITQCMKTFMMIEKMCIESSDEIVYRNEISKLTYSNYFSDVLESKKWKFDYVHTAPHKDVPVKVQPSEPVPEQDIDEEKDSDMKAIIEKRNSIVTKKTNRIIADLYRKAPKNSSGKLYLIASTQYPRFGGASTCAYELHRYLLNNGFQSHIVFFDSKQYKNKEDIDPDNIGNVSAFPLKNTTRLNMMEFYSELYKKTDVANKIYKFYSKHPDVIIGFNYLAPIIMKAIYPDIKVFFSITGSKIMSTFSPQRSIVEMLNDKSASSYQDYLEKYAILCTDGTIPNSGLTKHLFRHIYPSLSHKMMDVWDMHEIFSPAAPNKNYTDRKYDVVFISSYFSRNVKNVQLVKKIFESPKMKGVNKVCIGADSTKHIKKSRDISHFGFLTKDSIDDVLNQAKIVIIPSFMESYSIANREAINSGCTTITTRNVGNSCNMHKFFLCESLTDENEWIDKIQTILKNFSYYKHLASNVDFTNDNKIVNFIPTLTDTKNEDKPISILIASVDLPYIGGSGTNSYNLIKYLSQNNNKSRKMNVYGWYFAHSTQNGSLDPDKLSGKGTVELIMRVNIDKTNERELTTYAGKIPELDVIFCKNYKIHYALNRLFPKALKIYSPSGLRHLTANISRNPQFLLNYPEEDYFKETEVKEEIKTCDMVVAMKKFDEQLDSYALECADAIVPNSSITYDIISKHPDESVRAKLVRSIPMTNIGLTNRKIDRAFAKRTYDVGFVCYSWKRACKNKTMMLKILSKLVSPVKKILIIGQNLTEKLPEHVDHIDYVEHSSINAYLKRVKILVACSYFDSNPNTIIEAIQNGCNVITSKNVGGYQYLPEDSVVEDFENENSWVESIGKNLKRQIDYTGPNIFEVGREFEELINNCIAHNTKDSLDRKTCVGVYKVPAILDQDYVETLSNEPFRFTCAKEKECKEYIEEIYASDIYFLVTIELANRKQLNKVHYITMIDEELKSNICYAVSEVYPTNVQEIYLWKLKSIDDLLHFRKAGLYFLRGTYHNVYQSLIDANAISVCYPATSVPFTKLSFRESSRGKDLVDCIGEGNKSFSDVKYNLVLSNVDSNGYDKLYPNCQLSPLYKFSPNAYYLTNSGKRDIDILMVATATQTTKNHHLLDAFLKYLDSKSGKIQKSYSVTYVGDIELLRTNKKNPIPNFGNYKNIDFNTVNKLSSSQLRELYNRCRINILFSGRDAVPRVIFESSACGCYNIALDTLSDGKYFFNEKKLGALVGSSKVKIEMRPSKSISYISGEKTLILWDQIIRLVDGSYNHAEIATIFNSIYSVRSSVNKFIESVKK